MFQPKFTYSYKLIGNLGAIRELIGQLNERRFPNTVLLKLEKDARALSSHSSTSIEGNPIPLTDVKKILKTQPKYIRDTEKEVLNYNSSLLYLDKLLEKEMELSDKLIRHVQKLVTMGLVPKYAAGAYRKQPVLVNNPITREVIYCPPDQQDVAPLMSELLDFSKAA
jgi:Fic family protein